MCKKDVVKGNSKGCSEQSYLIVYVINESYITVHTSSLVKINLRELLFAQMQTLVNYVSCH